MLIEKSVKELSDLLNKNEISSVEIAKEYSSRIISLNEKINAYITFDEEALLNQAAEADKRRLKGEKLSDLDGIPLAIKDNISTKGVRTTCGSKILSNYEAAFNATSFQKLNDLGYLLLGKSNCDEFAMGSSNENSYFGIVRNPHNLDCVPGGSSGGSAAAVAANMAPASLGSDTGGSIRQPAAFCGVVGIKPTYGRVSRYGLVAYASSLDQIGTFARTVDDAAIVLAHISGGDLKDSTSVNKDIDFLPENLTGDIKGLRIGVPEEYFKGVNQEIKDLVFEKIKTLESQGAEIVNISLKMTDYAIPVYYLIATAEASSNLSRFDGVRYGYRSENSQDLMDLYKYSRSEGFGKEVKRRIMLGTFALSSGYYDAYYVKAMKGRTMIINDFKAAFEKVDAIITPTTPSTAFKIGEKVSDPLEMYASDILTISANLAAVPGISVPIGKDSKNLPIGMQIMGRHFEERVILNLAKNIEMSTGAITAEI